MATNIPPHNIAELCDACLHLIKVPDARDDTLLNYVPGPDFPTGGVIVEPPENIAQAYRTGRGSFRLRCKFEVEDLGRGQWQIVVTEIPYQVQKSKLIEKIAELIQTKKIPILADVRDESADDIRLILEPRSKNVDPEVLMGMLYRNSDLEVRFSLNMNVLIDGVTPKVCSMKEVLRAFLDHRQEVLLRRSRHRMAKIDHRLEVLEGFIVAFLNLDRVIDIIRYDDDPKAALMREDWGIDHVRATSEADYISPAPGEGELSEVQAEAILNMRLRSLRRLEEMELIRERDALMEERANLEDLLADDSLQWAKDRRSAERDQEDFWQRLRRWRATHPVRRGRTGRRGAAGSDDRQRADHGCLLSDGLDTGHDRAHRPEARVEVQGRRRSRVSFSTQRQLIGLLVFASNGRFYTVSAANLPGGRGMGEPLRLMVDLPNEAQIIDILIHKPGRKLLVASDAGNGFMVPEDEVLAQTRNGKQVLNVKGVETAMICKPIDGDHVAVVSQNGKFLVFPTEELPEMTRGKGVRLQKYNMARGRQGTLELDGGLSDITTFNWEEGLKWSMGGDKTRHEADMSQWLSKRASVGKKAPYGFPRDYKFS